MRRHSLQRLTEVLMAKYQCYPVFLEPDLRQKFYKGFCKQQLWPLLHYVLPMSPYSMGRFDPELWQAYVRANMVRVNCLALVCLLGCTVGQSDANRCILQYIHRVTHVTRDIVSDNGIFFLCEVKKRISFLG